jgi:hypothetical protein
MAEPAKQRSIITDKVVVERTGKTMVEWFEILDEKGAKRLNSQGICALIQSIDGLKPLGEWNQGLLSTSYQWDRGLRARGEKADGFEISVSRTVAVPVGELYRSFVDHSIRAEWLSAPITVTTTTENRSARAVWGDGTTRLSIDFYPKGDAKSQIVVQHLKILDGERAAELKEFWAAALNKLKGILESI